MDSGVGTPDRLERLWAPYRSSYITEAVDGDRFQDPFVAAPQGSDEDGLIVARGETVYALLNLYPYNSGHLMVVPYRKVAELENLTDQESRELMEFAQKAVRTLKAVSHPEAINVGLNLGKASGGSVGDHLHLHVVPRWAGDANFMTVIGVPRSCRSCSRTRGNCLPTPGPAPRKTEEAPMLSVHGREPAAVVVEPVARGLLRAGLTPNVTTLVGTVATVLVSVVLIPLDHLVWAALLSAFFAAFDMVDGTMARLGGGGTAFGRRWTRAATGSPTERSSAPSRCGSSTSTAPRR